MEPPRIITLLPRPPTGAAAQLLRLCVPLSEEEACPITLQAIAGAASLFDDAPLLRCAQLELCGHRFAATPLLTFFCSTNMRCPLCRQGDETQRLSLHRTFPGQAWAAALQARCDLLYQQQHPSSSSDDEDDEDDDDDDDDDFPGLTRAMHAAAAPHRQLDAEAARVQAMAPQLDAFILMQKLHHPNADEHVCVTQYRLQHAPYQPLRRFTEEELQPRYMLGNEALAALSQMVRLYHYLAPLQMSVRVVHYAADGRTILWEQRTTAPQPLVRTGNGSFSALLHAEELTLRPPAVEPSQFRRVTSFVFLPTLPPHILRAPGAPDG